MKIIFIDWATDYAKLMIANLSMIREVKEINRFNRHFKKINKLLILNALKKAHTKLHVFIKLRGVKRKDIVICNGYSILKTIDLVSQINNYKILILRDTVEKLNVSMTEKGFLNHGEHYLSRVIPVFDKIYTFDKSDCKNFQLTYLNPFLSFTSSRYQLGQEQSTTDSLNGFFYVGACDTYRENILSQMLSEFDSRNIGGEVYLVSKDKKLNVSSRFINRSLSYEENINKVRRSGVVLEINRPGQVGITLRAIEALFFGKKLITTNRDIIHCDFYSSGNIFIWGEDDLSGLSEFLSSPFNDEVKPMIDNYTADYMIERIVKDRLTISRIV